jgi:Reverse transcriptase (RNA-dependent DNA polymerase)
MKIQIKGIQITLGSIYGPNHNDMVFYENLHHNLNGSENILIGGDFNCTWDPRQSIENLDTLNMVQIPSKIRSEKINEIATDLKLMDPFRFLHPVERDFTYVPNAHRNINRSRIDFFLCSEHFGKIIKKCWIEPSVISSLFDHKMIRLSTCIPSKKINRSVIKDEILKNRLVKLAVLLCAKDTHLIHLDKNIMPGTQLRGLLEHVGLGQLYLSEIIRTERAISSEKNLISKRLKHRTLENRYNDLEAYIETLPTLELLESYEKECGAVLFFETLVNNIKNMTLKIQDNIYKAKNLTKKNLTEELFEFKKNFKANMKEIFLKEKELSIIIEQELKDELSLIKGFKRLNDEKITPHFLNLAKNLCKDPDLTVIVPANDVLTRVPGQRGDADPEPGPGPGPGPERGVGPDAVPGADPEHALGAAPDPMGLRLRIVGAGVGSAGGHVPDRDSGPVVGPGADPEQMLSAAPDPRTDANSNPNKRRSDYIVSFYENLYKTNPDVKCDSNSIPNFLGGVMNSAECNNTKLTEAEKIELDQPLNVTELDKALKESNLKSAPGQDGINNRFIKSFWEVLRIPLFDCSVCCLENGQLTDAFRTAKIKLIPKKGDLTKLTNWRPISLLNCFYKIISRAISNRLKKVMDKITRVGQKGYSKTKQCQEVLISLICGIKNAGRRDAKGLLISLDMKKA